MRKIAGWNARPKFIERRLLHPGLNRSPHGRKRGEQVRHTTAHHLEERTHAAYHDEAVPETSCSHHVPGDLWRRLLPKAAYFEHGTCVRAVQRHTRLDPVIAVFRPSGATPRRTMRSPCNATFWNASLTAPTKVALFLK